MGNTTIMKTKHRQIIIAALASALFLSSNSLFAQPPPLQTMPLNWLRNLVTP